MFSAVIVRHSRASYSNEHKPVTFSDTSLPASTPFFWGWQNFVFCVSYQNFWYLRNLGNQLHLQKFFRVIKTAINLKKKKCYLIEGSTISY